MVASPHCACTSKAYLDLVEDQSYAVLVADLSQSLEVSIWWNHYASFALDRLYDQACNLFANSFEVLDSNSCSISVTKLNVLYLLYHWDVVFSVCALAAHGDSAHGLAVECAYSGDVPSAACCQSSQLQSHFYSFSSAVGEEAVLQISRCDQSQQVSQITSERVNQFLRVQGISVELCHYSLLDLRIAVSAGEDTETAQAVDELCSVKISEYIAFVFPLDECSVCGYRLSVLEPSRVNVLVEVCDGFLHDSFFLLFCEGISFNQTYNSLSFF